MPVFRRKKANVFKALNHKQCLLKPSSSDCVLCRGVCDTAEIVVAHVKIHLCEDIIWIGGVLFCQFQPGTKEHLRPREFARRQSFVARTKQCSQFVSLPLLKQSL